MVRLRGWGLAALLPVFPSAALPDPPTIPAESLLRQEPSLVVVEENREANGDTRFRLRFADGTPVCPPETGTDPPWVYVVAGTWDASGHWTAGGFSVACPGGALAKCIRHGFRPWAGDLGRAQHLSCIRMVRADYCGDGTATTRPGIQIRPIAAAGLPPGDRIEAGWSPDGAVVVFRTRTDAGAAHVARSCPERLNRAGPWPTVVLWNE